MKPSNSRLHSAEDSPDEVNFKSAAVATNKNLLINRDECEISTRYECLLHALTFGLIAVGWN